MKCTKIKKRLSALLDDEIKAREEHIIKEHLNSCPDCERERQRLISVYAALDDGIRLSADAFMLTRVKARVQKSRSRPERVWLFAQKALVPATILAGLWVGVLLGLQLNSVIHARAQKSSIAEESVSRYSYIDPNIYEPIPDGSITASYVSLHTTQ